MKKSFFGLLFVLSALAFFMPVASGQGGNIIVSGIVKDAVTKKPVSYATVSIPGTNIGVVSNDDGVFSVRIPAGVPVEKIQFSHIGYISSFYDPGNGGPEILLMPVEYPIKEISVTIDNPMKIIESFLSRIEENYPDSEEVLTSFYRETVSKRNRYIDIAEAVAYVYKGAYSENTYADMVEMYKGRRLVSPKSSDTLAVKLMGGMNLMIDLDVVKNRDILFSDILAGMYALDMDYPDMIDDRPHYVIVFVPRVRAPYPMMSGRMYIDQQSHALSQVELRLDMSNKTIVERNFVRQKPAGLRFIPDDLVYRIVYRETDGVYRLQYSRYEFRFRCDWKRKLFASRFEVVSENVTTDVDSPASSKLKRKDAFKRNVILSEKVSDFYDAGFWEEYNIIEPTTSLESAVSRLRKSNERHQAD